MSDLRDRARDMLDKAIRDYVTATQEAQPGDGDVPAIVTGWTVVLAAVRHDLNDGEVMTCTESMPGQPFYVSAGLHRYAEASYLGSDER